MEAIPAIFSALVALSAAANVFLFFSLRAAKKRPPKAPTLTAEDLIHDLTSRGNAILKVTVIDPSSFLLRSPKH